MPPTQHPSNLIIVAQMTDSTIVRVSLQLVKQQMPMNRSERLTGLDQQSLLTFQVNRRDLGCQGSPSRLPDFLNLKVEESVLLAGLI